MIPPSARKAFPRRVVLSLALVVALVFGTIVLVNVVVQAKLGSAERVSVTLASSPSGGGANYLIVGSDTRSFIDNEADSTAFGDSSDTGGQRSDTIMVLHTDPDSSRSLLVSFPRDLWVDIPGHGSSKINAAFNDGPQAVIDTIASNFNVPIQHYVEVNFDSFRQIVDAVGTVPVLFPTPARDTLSGLNVTLPGCNHLDGPSALAFVRSRHLELLDNQKWVSADAIPDLGRIGRQQAFLRELGKLAMDEALSNPFKGNDIVDSAVSRLTVDSDFGRTDVFTLVDAFAAGDPDGASGPESQAIPTTAATRGGQSVLEPTGDAEALLARLRDFETTVPSADSGDVGDATPDDTTVRVLNASGAEGAASGALAGLKAQGFHGDGTGNSDRSLTTSEIRYSSGSDDKAALVKTFVSGKVSLVEDDSIEGADVVLVIGSSFGGITAAAAPSPQSPTNPAPAGIPQPASLAPVPGGC